MAMDEEGNESIESQILRAMRSRVQHFHQQADSLTFEGVRRLLEKDMGLEAYALDVHKRFIKQCLMQCMEAAAADGHGSKNSAETLEDVMSSKGEVAAESTENQQEKKEVKEPNSEDEKKMEDSPVMGLLSQNKSTNSETEVTGGTEKKVPSENTIKKAILKRASYFKANSEEITMARVRRLLEEDLQLDKNTLDHFKEFISDHVEKVLRSPEVSKSANGKNNTSEKACHRKSSKKISSEGSYDSLDSENDEDHGVEDEDHAVEDEVKSKKKRAPKGKMMKSEVLKKCKRPAKETKVPRKKKNKLANTTSEENSDSADGGNVSEDDGQSQFSTDKPLKKKEASAPAYGKRVEHLKSVIKSCAMSVAPSVYRRAKEVPETKREAFLIKELEGILSKEGLSANPTEKEIKEARKRKETAKELEGIDLSNIVSSSRRRSTSSFVAPPKLKVPPESDEDDAGENDNDNDDDDGDDEDDNDGDENDDSQSEEFDEGDGEDSD